MPFWPVEDAMRFDTIWLDARLATLAPRGLGIIERGTVAAKDGRIAFAGPMAELPTGWDALDRVGLDGRWVTPGLVDCHTHLVYAGNRAHEFELRLAGASYEEIARAGGGIVSTVKATRAASEDGLVAATLPRLDCLLADGVTTVEIKSGYGLDRETEVRMLRAARRLAQERKIAVITSFLGAHALPPEANGDKERYIDEVCAMIPAVARDKLADAVDAFCENIAFSPEQTARVFRAAQTAGLPVKLHADQLSNLGGAKLAADFGALSADHLEYTDEDGVAAMARAGTVAVLLPGAFYVLREKQVPPVDALRRQGVPIAIATDSNPGTSPITSLLLILNMAATLFGLTVDEAIAGVTREAARAVGRRGEIGTLEPGKWCDLAIWNIERPAELVYRIGLNPLHARVWRGT
ncbi:MAG TPA: imidazolonepropionase [Xanthobacteraceae bacterium]|jgi:imidazolonepropionase|nr:imidazolonepropionase [Xanthobacteraceae bacterium]